MKQQKMRVAQLAPLWIPVPPRTYGGIELIVHTLTEMLTKKEYDVTLYASGDSVTSAKLAPMVDQAIWLSNPKNPHAHILRMLKTVSQDMNNFDVIHNHFNFFMFPLALMPGHPPLLTTIHNPVDKAVADAIIAYNGSMNICAISEDHKKSLEELGVKVRAIVYNGIDVSKYEFNETPGDYVLYLSRLNKEKGVLKAIDVSKRADEKLVVAGNSAGTAETLFFLNELQPVLNDPHISFRGQVDFTQKVELLKNAKALLFPIDRREPFGLVMIEAMACGTPVIAWNHGSVPEIIEHGKTGFIVNSDEEMIEAIKNIGQIRREDCRAAVAKKFNLETMVDSYEKLYKEIIDEHAQK